MSFRTLNSTIGIFLFCHCHTFIFTKLIENWTSEVHKRIEIKKIENIPFAFLERSNLHNPNN